MKQTEGGKKKSKHVNPLWGDGSLEARPCSGLQLPMAFCLMPNFQSASTPPSFVWPCKYPLGLFISLQGLCAETLELIWTRQDCFPPLQISGWTRSRSCLSHSGIHWGKRDANTSSGYFVFPVLCFLHLLALKHVVRHPFQVLQQFSHTTHWTSLWSALCPDLVMPWWCELRSLP